jgi:hypothetical protein
MKATVERRGGKQIPPFGRNDKRFVDDNRFLDDNRFAGREDSRGRDDKRYSWFGPGEDLRRSEKGHLWAATCATAGAAVWAGIAVLARVGMARMGAIELLFLFGPLVIVPLCFPPGAWAF